jgi:hypothetical protein
LKKIKDAPYFWQRPILIFFVVEPGALYCGTITDTQLAATITALINSQTTG